MGNHSEQQAWTVTGNQNSQGSLSKIGYMSHLWNNERVEDHIRVKQPNQLNKVKRSRSLSIRLHVQLLKKKRPCQPAKAACMKERFPNERASEGLLKRPSNVN
eukprot:1151958-Pelagomonas_calceolata.AAC.7